MQPHSVLFNAACNWAVPDTVVPHVVGTVHIMGIGPPPGIGSPPGMGWGFPGKVKLPKQFRSVKILGVSSRANA